MKFTDNQKEFINDSLNKDMRKERQLIEEWINAAEKENDLVIKNGYTKMVEYHVQKLEELESLLRMMNGDNDEL